MVTKNGGDVTVKFYYAKRQMVWEVLDGALKSKLEMPWSNISAIRVSLPEGLPGIFEIKVFFSLFNSFFISPFSFVQENEIKLVVFL